jgi:hypothetical protein
MRGIVGLLLLALTVGCDSGTSPSRDPSLSFAPVTPSATGTIFWLEDAPGAPADQIAIRVHARSGARFHKFRGAIFFDDRTLTVLNYSLGEYMGQDGAATDVSVTGLGSGRVSIRIDRPDTILGATGSGVVLTLRFKAATGVRSGASPLQWDDPHAYTASFSDVLAHAYGGTITIQ